MAFDKPHATAVKMNVAKYKTNPIVNNTKLPYLSHHDLYSPS